MFRSIWCKAKNVGVAKPNFVSDIGVSMQVSNFRNILMMCIYCTAGVCWIIKKIIYQDCIVLDSIVQELDKLF